MKSLLTNTLMNHSTRVCKQLTLSLAGGGHRTPQLYKGRLIASILEVALVSAVVFLPPLKVLKSRVVEAVKKKKGKWRDTKRDLTLVKRHFMISSSSLIVLTYNKRLGVRLLGVPTAYDDSSLVLTVEVCRAVTLLRSGSRTHLW